MKYLFNEDFKVPIKDRILKIKNLSENELDTSSFLISDEIAILNDFKDKILKHSSDYFLIVGDYDCDGICATTIIKKLLDDLGIKNNYYIPSRLKEGYGLNNNIVKKAYDNNFNSIICVDNGIVASEPLRYAKELGLNTFIIDHHNYQDNPLCDSFLHPNLFAKKYSNMCASGLCALLSNSFRNDDFSTALGGIATLADMVEVFGYNRYLILNMLDILKKGNIRPISLLLGSNDVNCKNIQFNVIPKINAVSRLDEFMNVNYVVKFLLSNGNESLTYYDKIENINSARKNISNEMYSLASRKLDANKNVVIVKDKDFKEGLCGLVANKLLNDLSKPVLIMSETDGLLKGSGRGIPGSNIYEYLKEVDYLFETFGGHELAVGFSMKSENFDKLLQYCDEHPIHYEESIKNVIVLEQDKINFELLKNIEELEPYGSGFEEPLFAIKKPKSFNKTLVSNKYPKYFIDDNFEAISFNTKLINDDFEYMIGSLKKDNYHKNKIVLMFEDLC